MRTLVLFVASVVTSLLWLVTEHQLAFLAALCVFCLLAWEAIRPTPRDDLAPRSPFDGLDQ